MSEEGRSLVPLPPGGQGEFLVYQTEDGRTRVACRFAEGTVWLTQATMAELFQTTPQNITLHIAAIYEDQELQEDATCKEYLQVRREGRRQVRRRLRYYTLPMILAVGYRVRSSRGALFRQRATARLEEYLVKGFTMDDERLKRSGGGDYFDELLARIRDIRSSERVFWPKVLDIYSTSIDYDPRAEASQQFFAVVQNKMRWTAHGNTAAEVISSRVDAAKPNMGMTTWSGSRPRRSDAFVAKNYLDSKSQPVDAHFEAAIEQTKRLAPKSPRKPKGARK